MNRALWLACIISIGGCEIFSPPTSCSTHESSVFIAAWKEQLTEKGIAYEKKNESTLCFTQDQSADGHKARMAAESVYRGAATIVETDDEKAQLLEYIRRESREYDEQPLDAGRSFFVVFSNSRAQFDETQVVFSCIQHESDCLQ